MNINKFFQKTEFIKKNPRLKENIFYQIFNFAIKIVNQIFFPVLMIYFFGGNIFGIWIIIYTIVLTINSLNFNIVEVSKNIMIGLHEEKKNTELNLIYSNYIIAHSVNFIFFIITSIIIYFLLDFNSYLYQDLKLNSLKICFLFVIFGFFIENITLVYYPILTFKGLTKKWINQSTLFEFYSKVLLIFSVVFNDFLYLGFFFLLANILRLILIIFLKNKENIHNIKFEIKLVKKNVLKELILKSLSYSLEKLNYILKQNGLILMIGYFFSPILVTMISTARTLFYYLPINFFDIITKPAVIEFGKLKSSASNDIRNLLKKFLFLILIFSIIYLLAANLFGKYIYDFWIDNDLINLTRITIFLISIDAILIGLINILFVPFKAFNNFFFLSKIDFCFTVIAILIAFYLSLFFNSLNLILLIMVIFHLMLFFFLKFIIPSEIRKL